MGYSQEEMADELGFKEGSSYWRFEYGSTRMLNRRIYRLAELSGRSVEEILLGQPLKAFLNDSGAEDNDEKLQELRLYYENIIEAQKQELREKDETISNLNDYIKSLKRIE